MLGQAWGSMDLELGRATGVVVLAGRTGGRRAPLLARTSRHVGCTCSPGASRCISLAYCRLARGRLLVEGAGVTVGQRFPPPHAELVSHRRDAKARAQPDPVGTRGSQRWVRARLFQLPSSCRLSLGRRGRSRCRMVGRLRRSDERSPDGGSSKDLAPLAAMGEYDLEPTAVPAAPLVQVPEAPAQLPPPDPCPGRAVRPGAHQRLRRLRHQACPACRWEGEAGACSAAEQLVLQAVARPPFLISTGGRLFCVRAAEWNIADLRRLGFASHRLPTFSPPWLGGLGLDVGSISARRL